jgi:predicted Fe-Mo cluster-binding NifX family protein
MKIAISATQPSLEGEVDPRFGRCRYFIIADPETTGFETLENPHADAVGGAGIATAQFVASQGVQEILTGSLGPNAQQVLATANIKMHTGISGKISDVIEAYKTGQLRPAPEPGISRGMARGRRGMGRRMGPGPGYMPGRFPGPPPGQRGPVPTSSREEEISYLKNQARMLGQELAEIKRRLDLLEKQKEK